MVGEDVSSQEIVEDVSALRACLVPRKTRKKKFPW